MIKEKTFHNRDMIKKVIQRDLAWAQAHLCLNLVVIEQILTDNFRQRQLDSTYKSKTDLLASYSSGKRYWKKAKSTDHHIQIDNDLAIIVGRWHGKGINFGKEFDYSALFLSVYELVEGSWKMVLDTSISNPE